MFYSEVEIAIDVPERDHPLRGTAARPALLVAPLHYDEVVRTLRATALDGHKVAVSDMDGIGWRTGHRAGGRAEQSSFPQSPEAALGCLAVALGRVHETPFDGNVEKEVHLLWSAPPSCPPPPHHRYDMDNLAVDRGTAGRVSWGATTTDSFHLYQQVFERQMPGADLFLPGVSVTIHYTEDAWGATPFTTLNCEEFSDVHKEAMDWLRDGDDVMPWWRRRLAHHLAKDTASAALALAVLHLARDRGARFVPMASPRGVVQGMYGAVPADDETHKTEVEIWPEVGGEPVLSGAAPHLYFSTLHIDPGCRLALRTSGDPTADAKKHRIRATLTAAKTSSARIETVRLAVWALLPAGGASGEAFPPIRFLYVSDMSHRGMPDQYQSTSAAVELAPLPGQVASQLADIHRSIDRLHIASDLAIEDPGAAEGVRAEALQVCRDTSAIFYDTLTIASSPACKKQPHPALPLVASSQTHFAHMLMQLQQRLQSAMGGDHHDLTRPSKRPMHAKSLVTTVPQRMSSMGAVNYAS